MASAGIVRALTLSTEYLMDSRITLFQENAVPHSLVQDNFMKQKLNSQASALGFVDGFCLSCEGSYKKFMYL